MNIAVCLLVLLPMVYCASIEKRLVVGDHQFHLSDIVAALKHALGSNTALSACEHICPSVIATIPGASLFSHQLCSAGCHALHLGK